MLFPAQIADNEYKNTFQAFIPGPSVHEAALPGPSACLKIAEGFGYVSSLNM
jgi:hypothetical protein